MIEESELVLNKDGSVYHLHLRPEQVAKNIIVAGDPARIAVISSFFDKIEHKVQNREFITHTGWFNGESVTALCTGIGTDNIDIVLNELDALFNIDLKRREVKEDHTSLNIVRIGTSGSLQADIPEDSFVASEWGLGLDNLMHYYRVSKTPDSDDVLQHFCQHANLGGTPIRPYLFKASEKLFIQLSKGMFTGITATAPGFYGPQGRILRLQPAFERINEKLNSFKYNNLRITNFEMETSALYGLSSLLGHNACTVCSIVANRFTRRFSKNYQLKMKELIELTLQRLTAQG
ncbi:MAG: nucleoside phosphorylase [Flavobacteriales bacterium]|nr:nucleoside phosphorylase [Flavobacteriales bacterium]